MINRYLLRPAARTVLLTAIGLSFAVSNAAEKLPIIDGHIHYSHDAVELLPPERAVVLLRQANLKRAFVSSSNDDGTQLLYAVAPDLVVPVLRPYRKRGELSTWVRDLSVVSMLRERLKKYRYAGIGEFHAFGDEVDLPVMRGLIDLARQYGLFLHAHSDADAVERIFGHYPEARVLWAHSGFTGPDEVGAMLAKYPNLWADLAFRDAHARDGKVDPDWLALFEKFPNRMVLGTDTYTPERWFYVIEHAEWSRGWLTSLPPNLANNIAWRNAQRLLDAVGWK
ncbi:MAG: amidohydrolase family protein [Pseudomonadota bacterium]